jgi:hypothetical protein
MPSPAELKTVGDNSCSTLEEEEDVHELELDLIHHNESAYPPPLF